MNAPQLRTYAASLLAGLCMAAPLAQAAPTRVACVGDSITYGMGVANREQNSYPAQLWQKMEALAPGQWEVRNFGVSAMTLMHGTTRPYTGRPEYRASLDYAADVVIIMLGTNDTNGQFRHQIAENFEGDYRRLIASYRAGRAPGTPRIILMLPPKCHLAGDGLYDPSGDLIAGTIAPIIRRIAADEKLELIDLHASLVEVWQPELIPDKLHPSARGQARMVEHIAPVVLGQAPPTPSSPGAGEKAKGEK